jgi:hypothetical protein
MARDATRTLNNAMDSVNLINQINDGDFSYFQEGYTQEIVNRRVQENVQHLEIILAYEEVVEDETDKTPYTTAITTGKAYLEENS